MTCTISVATTQYNSGGNYPPRIDKNDNVLEFADYTCKSKNKERRAPVRINRLHWEQIPRANNPQKVLQEKAVNLLSVIEYKLRKTDLVLLNHKYLSTITKCKKDQNVNLLKQLDHIFDIKFHVKYVVGDKIYRNCYVIKHTQRGREIIENSKSLLKEKLTENKMASKPEETKATKDKKEQPSAEFFPSSSIYKKEEYKNRSMKSNFIDQNYSNNSKVFGNDKTLLQNKLSLQQDKSIKFGKPKKLSCFYPLDDSDVAMLQRKSGRDFSKTAMNEILKDMCRKLTKPEFWSKKGFLSYMSKAFKYELRDAVKISNETFRIRANNTEEEKQERLEEEYLTKLENNLHVSSEWHLRKKLASTLDRSRAYSLLTSLQRVELDKMGIMNLYLSKKVELSQMDKVIILNQAKATHEKYKDGKFTLVKSLEIINQNTKNNYQQERDVELSRTQINNPKGETLWGRVRIKLQEKYGIEMDKAWFSRLETRENKANKEKQELTLIAESSFYKDWIERNYLEDMVKITKEEGYILSEIKT